MIVKQTVSLRSCKGYNLNDYESPQTNSLLYVLVLPDLRTRCFSKT
jgi:hypothetical protein